MQILRVHHQASRFEISLRLPRFITDWPTAQQRFIGGLADRFQDWHPLRARDFSVVPALSLEDMRCRCRLFGGLCDIVLGPEALELTFEEVKREAWPLEVVRRSSHWLSSELGEHGPASLWINTVTHMPAVEDGAVDRYLARFVPESAASEVKQAFAGARYLPSAHMTFAGDDGGWVLRRAVEKSAQDENSVFVSTQIHVQSMETLDSQPELFDRLDELADRVIGLQREEETR